MLQMHSQSLAVTFGNVSSNMSTMAASRYSRQASAFFDSCSASALALALMANASASPRTRICAQILNYLLIEFLSEKNVKG